MSETKINKQLSPIGIFYSYAQEDEEFREKLEKHLAILRRNGVVKEWHFRKIKGGEEWKNEIDENIKNSQIILLLVSSDFLSSDYCYNVEMKKAMELHKNRLARVIPIILRAVDWHDAPFGEMQALPKDGKPITSWENRDEAFLDISQGVKSVCEEITRTKLETITSEKPERKEIKEEKEKTEELGSKERIQVKDFV